MILAPAALRRHRERGGESPSPSSSLASPLDGRRVPPLVHGLHGSREPLRDWISLSILLHFAFLVSSRKPFLIFLEIRNSNCTEILTRFFPNISFLATEVEVQPMYEVGTTHHHARGLWRALVSCALCRPPFAVIPTPKNHIYSKIILRKFLSSLGFV